jgi:uncharacterized protein (DUF736 family)
MNETREDFELNMNESNDEQAPNASDSPNGYENNDEEPAMDSDIEANAEPASESEPKNPRNSRKPNPLDIAMQANRFEKARLVLFNFNPENKEPGKEYPALSGHLECKDFKVNVSGFLEQSRDTGRHYLSVSVGSPGHEKIYGRLFKDEAEGKENEYFGTISKSTDAGQKDSNNKTIYQTLWEVQIAARQKRSSKTGQLYIDGDLYIKRTHIEKRLPKSEALAF